jgi:pre-mRNA-splicing factor RBM22/SLT11
MIYPYGQYHSIRIVPSANCAFVDYVDRYNAEYAVGHLYNNLMIHGRPVSVNWGKSKTTAVIPEGGNFSTNKMTSHQKKSYQPNSYSHHQTSALPPPPGMENVPLHYYALPNLPLPTAAGSNYPNLSSFPPPAAFLPPQLSDQFEDDFESEENQSKRQKI